MDETPSTPGPAAFSLHALAAELASALRDEAPSDAERVLDAIRAELAAPPGAVDASPAALIEAIDSLSDPPAPGELAALRRLAGVPAPLRAYSLAEAFAERPPERRLWTAGADGGELAGSGEVVVLAGSGSGGKSSIALEAALAAWAAHEAGRPAVELGCGLVVAAGRVTIATWEDAPARLGRRAEAMRYALAEGFTIAAPPPKDPWTRTGEPDKAIRDVYLRGLREWGADGPRLIPCVEPLSAPPPGEPGAPPRPTAAYGAVLDAAGRGGMLILDPGSAAYGANPNDAAGVRGFLARLASDAAERDLAVLVLAHGTKAGRRAAAAGADDGASRGAEAIAGSAQWHDAAPATPRARPGTTAQAEAGRVAEHGCGPAGGIGACRKRAAPVNLCSRHVVSMRGGRECASVAHGAVRGGPRERGRRDRVAQTTGRERTNRIWRMNAIRNKVGRIRPRRRRRLCGGVRVAHGLAA